MSLTIAKDQLLNGLEAVQNIVSTRTVRINQMKTLIKNLFFLPALVAGLGLIPAGRVTAQNFRTLHNFTAFLGSTNNDGAYPPAGLILSDNTLYGTAQSGGGAGYGTVFKVNISGTGFTRLYAFTGRTDGANPYAGLILSSNTLYGTTPFGGSSGYGNVFAVSTNGTGFTNLYSFTALNPTYSTNTDGAYPLAGLILSGNTLYGTAYYGGRSGNGTVFAVNTDGTGFTNLHSFTAEYTNSSGVYTNRDGAFPRAGLVLSGNILYGTAESGGSSNLGTVFALSTDGTGFTYLHSFAGYPSDGAYPEAGLILSGNTLYGTASSQGFRQFGTVFAVNTDGTGFTNLHSFTKEPFGTNIDGAYPLGGLILSSNTLYGTSSDGGRSGNGTVFKVNTNGSGFTTLYSFTATFGPSTTNTDGAYPAGALILSSNTLYGTAFYGGRSGHGTVFSLTNTVPVPPVILAQPQDQALVVGQNVTFTVIADGSSPLAYQWRFNNSFIAGATGTSLSLTNVQPGDAGSYSVRITNSVGIIVSSNANLLVGVSITNLVMMPRPSSAIIQWASVPAAASQIEYGIAPGYGNFSSLEGAEQTDHAVLLTGLIPNTNYVFRIHSHVGTIEIVSGQYAFSTDLTIIVDNPQAQYSGNWTLGTSSPDKYGASYQSAPTSAGFSPSALAIYTPAIITPAKYDVAIWYPQGANRTTNAQVSLFFNGGSVTKSVNQATGGGTWQLLLSAADFATGAEGFATIGNNTGESGKVVIADALRWSYVTSQDIPIDGTVPDWWSDFYFGGAVDATLDPDGDGYSTFAEYVLGTDPTSANSRLEFRAERSGGGLSISFSPLIGGRVYQLASTTNLTSGVWTVLPDVPTANGTEGSFIISSAATPARRYFRLQVHLSP